MSPEAFLSRRRNGKRPERTGMVMASLVAILFATFATVSFAIDQSVTYSVVTELGR